jgi:Arc/MetJ family transcription regulator
MIETTGRGDNMSDERQRVNIELDPELWKQVGIKAIEMGLTKRELTEKALREFIRKAYQAA